MWAVGDYMGLYGAVWDCMGLWGVGGCVCCRGCMGLYGV